MTRKVFWEDPYLTTLDTRITSVVDDGVKLEATIFYALSGGQESDAGRIAGRDVTLARWDGREIVYQLADTTGLRPGDAVQVEIDWPRRYRLMRLHFAAEIVLELVYQRLSGVDKIGTHIAADKARIDFAWPESIASLLPELQGAAQAIVTADQAIESAYSDRDGERRYWKIREFARVPCGGTHLRRTGEVGALALKRKNIGKGKERIEITLRDTATP